MIKNFLLSNWKSLLFKMLLVRIKMKDLINSWSFISIFYAFLKINQQLIDKIRIKFLMNNILLLLIDIINFNQRFYCKYILYSLKGVILSLFIEYMNGYIFKMLELLLEYYLFVLHHLFFLICWHALRNSNAFKRFSIKGFFNHFLSLFFFFCKNFLSVFNGIILCIEFYFIDNY